MRPSARALVLAAIVFVPGAARADAEEDRLREECRHIARLRSGGTTEQRDRCRVIWEEDARRRSESTEDPER